MARRLGDDLRMGSYMSEGSDSPLVMKDMFPDSQSDLQSGAPANTDPYSSSTQQYAKRSTTGSYQEYTAQSTPQIQSQPQPTSPGGSAYQGLSGAKPSANPYSRSTSGITPTIFSSCSAAKFSHYLNRLPRMSTARFSTVIQ